MPSGTIRKLALVRENAGAGDVTLVVDPNKIVTATRKLLSEGRDASLKALKESGVTLTDAQTRALESALGLVEGGKVEKMVDDATSVAEGADPDDPTTPIEEDETMEGAGKGKKPLANMTEAEVRKFAESAQAQIDAANKRTTDAKRLAESADGTRRSMLQEQTARALLVELKVPDSHCGRVIDEIMLRTLSESDMRSHIGNYMRAFVIGSDGAGAVTTTREGAARTGKIVLSYESGE